MGVKQALQTMTKPTQRALTCGSWAGRLDLPVSICLSLGQKSLERGWALLRVVSVLAPLRVA